MIGKKTGWALLIIFLLGIFSVYHLFTAKLPVNSAPVVVEIPSVKAIDSNIEQGETLFSVFQKHNLNINELFAMREASASVHKLKEVYPGQPYRFVVDDNNCITSFTYGINENTVLKIERSENGFSASKCETPYESRVLTLGGRIDGSLVAALGQKQEDIMLAVNVSEILGWDIDFNTDLRKGDTFKIIVEGLYLDGTFKKYGRVLAVEFFNDNRKYVAYRFEHNGRSNYYDAKGKSLKKAFLKAPLSFRRISSSFSRSRRHPILKVNRPHQGIDYVAPKGTPVNATADGRVSFAGRRGGYGKLIILKHRNSLQTYYGHLSRFASGIKTGKTIQQGELIGYVGATGLASGPHLHYEMRQNAHAVNPRRFKMEAGRPVPPEQMGSYQHVIAALDKMLASAVFYETAAGESRQISRNLATQSHQFPFFN